ncbi:MAG: PQQ-dependent sugar dehydrogenase, partial [Planctomycetota bacterium]
MMSALLAALPLSLGPLHDGLADLPPQFELLTIPATLTQPTDIESLPGLGLLVSEKRGTVAHFRHFPGEPFPVMQDVPVLNLISEVNVQGDRGLLGLAVAPDFTPDGGDSSWLYLLYTASPVPGADLLFNQDDQYSHSMLTRYALELDPAGRLVAIPESREVLLGERLPDGTAPDAIASLHESHSNGSIAFAPDGTLLFSTGDGAHFDTTDFGGIDPPGFDDYVHPTTGLRGQLPLEQDSGAFRSRDLRSLAGKVLRVDPTTGLGLDSNPYYDGDPTSLRSRVWASGFRNAFRLTHRPGTGATDPALADVGQWLVGDVGNTRTEELDLIDAPGLDFGWPCFEGFADSPGYASFVRPDPNPFGWLDCADGGPGPVRGPLLAIDHVQAQALQPLGLHKTLAGEAGAGFTGACVVGGDFFAGGDYPAEYQGRYLFSDYASGWLRSASLDAAGNLVEVTDFGAGLSRPTCITFDAT